jgi:CRP-like cAMP-binding protein
VPTLLGSLRPSVRDGLLALGVARSYPVRRRIITERDETRYVFLLLSGIVKAVVSTPSGAEALLDIRIGGDLVGEMAAFDGQPRSASVITCSVVEARLIKEPDLTGFLSRHPDAGREISRIIVQRLRWANRRRLDFVAHDAGTRIARVLVEIATNYGHDGDKGRDLGLELTQNEVATVAGVALPTAEKALAGFEHDGLIQRGYRRIIVTDLDRMRATAEADDNS